MGYKEIMEMAGAIVHVFENFGSYQGDWWAKVTYENTTGWVHGNYGSCSGCDAFRSEIGDYDSHVCIDGAYKYADEDIKFLDECKDCQNIKLAMVEFGKQYLDNIITQQEAEDLAAEDIDWDAEAQEMIDFIKEHHNTGPIVEEIEVIFIEPKSDIESRFEGILN